MNTHNVVLIPGDGIDPEVAGAAGRLFDAVHVSAPDIAGRGVANPLALIMSGVMMLNYLAETHDGPVCRNVGERIKTAYSQALANGRTTADLGGSLDTDAFVGAVIEGLP